MSVNRTVLNVAVGSLAAEFGVSEENFNSWADYESWLDDLTHHVADQIDTAGAGRWEVYDHVTGYAISRPFADQDHASSICASYNTPTSGGRYGVRRA